MVLGFRLTQQLLQVMGVIEYTNLSSVLATYCSKRAFSVCNEAVKNLRCVLLRCLV